MARLKSILERLSDAQLLLHLHDLIQRDHNLEAELVAQLGEVDARRLYLEQACSSMFHYCVRVLHFAEGVAYKRIAVARAARKFPVVLAALEKGDLHLTGACLMELQALLRPSIPDGDVAKVLARAVAALLEQVRKRKFGSCSSARSPRASTASDARSKKPSRHIPAGIRRQVWAREGGRCTYVSRLGRQCGAGEFLEFHHQVPWAHCREHAPSNIYLRCRAHNQYEAELAFGSEPMAAYRTSPSAGRVVEEAEPAAQGRQESQQDLNPVRAPSADPRAGTRGEGS